jgi:integrase
MKGSVYPRPSIKDPETGKLRPAKNATWTWQIPTVRNGKRRTIKRGGYRTRTEAQDALTTALAEYRDGSRVEPSKLTVREYFVTRWLPVVEHAVKPSTFRGYSDIVKNRIVPYLGDVKLSELTEGDVARLYSTLRSGGRRNGKGGLSEASLQHTHVVLRKALRDAVRGAHGAKLLTRNPADDVQRPRRDRTEMQVWSAEELRRFLDATRDDRLYACWVLAATTGMRRGELLGLRWEDIDLEGGILSVRRSRVAAGYVVTEGSTKSGRGRRVDLDPETVAILRRHRTRQLEERMAWGESWTDSGLVFKGEDGAGLHPQSVSQAFERRMSHVEVPTIRFHDLRHTHATLMLSAGVHPKIVQERLGHASITITLDTYSHVMPTMQADAAAKVGALVFGGQK